MLVNMLSTQMTHILLFFLGLQHSNEYILRQKERKRKRMQVKRCRDSSVHELFSRSKDKYQFSQRANTITRFCIKTLVYN